MSVLWPILAHGVSSPKRVAVIDDNRSYTYSQLLGGAMFMAQAIDESTSAPNVGIMLPTGGTFPIALLGTWLARRVAVPLNYLLSRQDLAYVIADSGIDTIITVGPLLSFIGGAEAIPPHIRLIHLEKLSFQGFPPLRWPPLYFPDELACLLYTSGTSGQPKGVMLSHGNLRSNVEAGLEHARISHNDVILGVLPQFHSFGLTALTLLPLFIGGKAVYTARFHPKKIVTLLRQHRPTAMMAVPSMYSALLGVKDAGREHFQSVRLAVSGGEPLPQAVFDEVQERFGIRLLEGYGLTETAPITNWSTPDAFKLRSVGRALPGVQIIIVDEHDKPLPADSEGEILIAGPNLMKGYYHLPQLTEEVIAVLDIGQGPTRFLRTGDIGKIDPDGFLFITGRKKEMLIIAGENVFPRSIEEVINRHQSVKDSAVIGRNDGLRGEVPVAYVELQEGSQFDATALRSWCREHLPNYMVPRDIFAVDSLPRSPTGKIMRRKLDPQGPAQVAEKSPEPSAK